MAEPVADGEDESDRRPCPMCGEMVKASAAKCRYCGEIFDEDLRRLEKRKKKRRESAPGGRARGNVTAAYRPKARRNEKRNE